MDYIQNLYQGLQDEAALNDFITQVFFNGENVKHQVVKFQFIEYDDKENDCIQLKIVINTQPIKTLIVASFADYGVKYCEEGDYGVKYYEDDEYSAEHGGYTMPSTRIFDMKKNYLQYMASHYDSYKEDCIKCLSERIGQKYQEKIVWLEDAFASANTDNL